MKKVFHFVSTNILSGLENVVINICNLVKKYDFTYVSPNGPINKYLNKYNIRHISIDKITPLNVRKVIKQYNPDVVQGHDVKASISLAFNSRLCHKRNIKIISELHSDDPRMWRYSLRSILYCLSSPFYDRIIVISDAVINHYIFKEHIESKTTIINNIVNVNRIPTNDLNLNKKWDCIFLGRLVDLKDPIKFVRIIYYLKQNNENISAIMVGEGPLHKHILNIINKYGLNKNIKVLGFRNNPYKYLKESKVCLVPSRFEGFGLVALESLLMGTPVISSPTGGLLNIVTTKCGGFAQTTKSFVQQVNFLLNDEYKYKLMSNNAFNHSHKINNLKKFILSYSHIYS